MNADILHSRLQDQCELAMQLVDVLTDEQTALIHLHADQLIELAVSKEALVVSMDQGLRDLLHDVSSAGLPSTLDGLTAWVAQLSHAVHQPNELNALCSNYIQCLTQAQRLNTVNAALVAEQLSSLQTRVNMLCVGRRDTDMTTYGPSGNLDGGNQGSALPCVVAS